MKIEIMEIWQDSRTYHPVYCLAAEWDCAEHYFTDYLEANRLACILPDAYEISEDQAGIPHIYRKGVPYPPLGLIHYGQGPAIADVNVAPLKRVQEEARHA